MSDKWEVKHSALDVLWALGEGVARLAGADPKPNYQGQDVKVRNRDTEEEKTVHVGWGQELGDAIAKGQFKDEGSSSGGSGGSSSDHSGSGTESRSGGNLFWVIVLTLAVVGGIVGGLFSAPLRSSYYSPNRTIPRVEDRRKPTPWSDDTTYYPSCVAGDEVVKIVDIMDLYRVAHIAVRADCWSQWLQPPSFSMYETNSSAQWEIMFRNGKRAVMKPGEKHDLGIVEGPIRVRGSGGEVTVKVY